MSAAVHAPTRASARAASRVLIGTARRAGVGVAVLSLAALPVVAGPGVLSAQAAGQTVRSTSTAPTGWLRIAHLAPKVGPVDITVNEAGSMESTVLHSVTYGSFTTYKTLTPGTYTVAMRLSADMSMMAPVASGQITVKAGAAYTLAAFGTPGHVKSEIFTDSLVRPASGSGRVRLVQGAPAAGSVTVTAVSGPLLATGLTYGSVTSYADVPQGRWTLKVTEDGKDTTTVVDVRAGDVYSLVVVQKANGGLTLDTGTDVNGKAMAAMGRAHQPVSMAPERDAGDSKTQPTGSVNTGEGGTAPGGSTADASGLDALGVGTAGAVALVAGSVLVRRRRITTSR